MTWRKRIAAVACGALGLAALLAGCRGTTPQASPRATVDELLTRMRDRLLLMHDVARAKWNAKRPITDPAREEAVLRAVEDKGRALGLDPKFTRGFFAAQMEASKRLQRDDFANWEAEKRGPFADAPDLTKDLRPRIDRLGAGLLDALARARPFLAGEDGQRYLGEQAPLVLRGPGITDEVRKAALHPLTAP